MCIFVKPVKEVKETRILVAPTKSNRVLVIYENFVGIDKGNRTNVANLKKIKDLEEKHEEQRNNSNGIFYICI